MISLIFQFHGMNIQKEKLITEVEKKTQIIEELRKCEHIKLKKMQKYAKFFIQNDENKSTDIKKMSEETNKFRKDRVKMNEKQPVSQTEEDGEDLENWREPYKETLKDNYNFFMLLDRYIEQNTKRNLLVTIMMKNTKLLADKDLEIWNLKKELQDIESYLARVVVDLSIARAKDQMSRQSISDDQWKNKRSCVCSGIDITELKNEMTALQGEGLSMKERINKLESDALSSGKPAKGMRAKLKDIIFKSKDFDDTIYDIADERKELIILQDFIKVTCRLEDRITVLEKYTLEKSSHNGLQPFENGRKRKGSFLGRILRKKA